MPKLRKKYLLMLILPLAALTIILILLFNYFHSEKPNPPEQLTVVLSDNALYYLSLLIAQEQGFFSEYNLKVNTEYYTAPFDFSIVDNTANSSGNKSSNSADICIISLEQLLFGYNYYPQLQTVAQLTKQDPTFLMSRTENESFNWENISGKSVITGGWEYGPALVLESLARKHQLFPQRNIILIQNIPDNLKVGAFQSGSGNYLQISEPAASTLESQDIAYKMLSLGQEAPEIPSYAAVTSQKTISVKSSAIEKFVCSLQKANLWLAHQMKQQNTKIIYETIKEYFPVHSKEILLKAIEQYYYQGLWPDTPVITNTAFDAYQNLIIDSGEMREKLPTENIIYNSAAVKAEKTVSYIPPEQQPTQKEQLLSSIKKSLCSLLK